MIIYYMIFQNIIYRLEGEQAFKAFKENVKGAKRLKTLKQVAKAIKEGATPNFEIDDTDLMFFHSWYPEFFEAPKNPPSVRLADGTKNIDYSLDDALNILKDENNN